MATERRLLHAGSNGDRWYLCRSSSGRVVVSHVPNAASGGKSSEIELGVFLASGNQGPEHQALRDLIGELITPERLEGEFDDHD